MYDEAKAGGEEAGEAVGDATEYVAAAGDRAPWPPAQVWQRAKRQTKPNATEVAVVAAVDDGTELLDGRTEEESRGQAGSGRRGRGGRG